MNLAAITSEGEYQNLIQIANDNPSSFGDGIFISSKSSDLSTDSMCVSFAMAARRSYTYKTIDSTEQQSKFLCESVEVSDIFEPKESREIVDVKSTFFRSLSSDAIDVNNKKYYLSRVALSPPAASVACKSFGMNLASPKAQEEFYKLKSLLSEFSESPASIALVRSATDKKIWLDSEGNEINYEINWSENNSWNSETNENCAVFIASIDTTMIDVSCNEEFLFICEDAQMEMVENSIYSQQEAENFLENFRNVWIGSSRLEFGFSKPSIQLSFFDAKLMCQSLGMELFSPDPNFDEYFITSNGASSFITSMTSMGTSDLWYSSKDGKIMSQITVNTDEDVTSGKCSTLVLNGIFEKISYKTADCTTKYNFICHKTSSEIAYEYKTDNYEPIDDDDDD